MIGGTAPVVVQSMTTTHPRAVAETLEQIQRLAQAGCELVRVAVPDTEAITGLREIVRQSPLPVIADIHFDHRLALRALEAGVHGLRINPGTIRQRDNVREVIAAARSGR